MLTHLNDAGNAAGERIHDQCFNIGNYSIGADLNPLGFFLYPLQQELIDTDIGFGSPGIEVGGSVGDQVVGAVQIKQDT